VSVRVSWASFLALFLLLFGAPVHAQAPPVPPLPIPQSPRPVTGFVSPYEIVRTVRAAGFDPLAPPLREGTTYVLRATDYRGILMRVVVDARTGAIRDANRIVPGPGRYGQFGMEQEPYGYPPYYGPQRHGSPPPYESMYEEPEFLPSSSEPPPRPPAPLAVHPARSVSPPLPRPRLGELASRKAKSTPAPTLKSDASSMSPAAAPAAPGKAPEPPIND
jgi:hypothetical protein